MTKPIAPTRRRVAILQSSYVPWKGYFDIIGAVDEFILYDTAQYTKNDWRNRNCIRTPAGTAWLTVPVLTTGRFGSPICDIEVSDRRWAGRHWRTLQTYYARAPHFERHAGRIAALYDQARDERLLTRINELFLRELCSLCGIATRITRSSEYELRGDRSGRLVHLCVQTGAAEYLTGPAARSYLDEDAFTAAGIQVRWMRYDGYPEYAQVAGPPFVHQVSLLDLLFNEGADRVAAHLVNTRRRGAE